MAKQNMPGIEESIDRQSDRDKVPLLNVKLIRTISRSIASGLFWSETYF